MHTQPIKSQYMQIFMFVSVSVSALFVLITISNTRRKRVNENITRQCTRQEKKKYNIYMQILMFVGFVVIEIRLFNRKKQKKMKNMATL